MTNPSRRTTFLGGLAAAAALAVPAAGMAQQPATSPSTPLASAPTVRFQQIRNATIRLTYGSTTFLVDPMLAAKGAYAGFPGTARSELRNPLVELPMPVSEVLKADAVILTHLHDDHWDAAARSLVARNMPIFTQNAQDADTVRKDGFTDVRVLTEAGVEFQGTRLVKAGGQHGTDAMYAVPALKERLGQAMGVVFQRPGHTTAYVVGDTVWRPEVEQALTRFQPGVVLLNTGYAQVNGFQGSIIMGKDDLLRAYRFAPQARLVAIHMEAVNHALLSRQELRSFIADHAMDPQRTLVPEDGEAHQF